MSEPTDYITAAEAAEELRISTHALAAWRHKLTGPPWRKFGGAVRYRLSEVREWADRQTVEGVK